MGKNFKTTYVACFLGVASQAVITCITAILFVPFMSMYGFSQWQFGVMIGVNFISQLIADVIVTKQIDKVPYRRQVISAQIIASVGLILFALSPLLFKGESLYAGMLIATSVFAFAGGMQEAILTPVINATEEGPAKKKAVALLHAFYPIAQAVMVIITALCLYFGGYESWQYAVAFWALMPLTSLIIFIKCPINQPLAPEKKERGEILKRGKGLILLLMTAIGFGGATEIIANQYISTFSTLALGIDKTICDVFGMAMFAIMMAIGRFWFAKNAIKVNVSKVLLFTASASVVLFLIIACAPNKWVSFVACVLSGLSVSLLWPGTLVVAEEKFPSIAPKMFAVLAICGDLGATIFPTAIGFVGEISLNLAFLVGAIIPLICAIAHFSILRNKKEKI